jgi:hypothetical protein
MSADGGRFELRLGLLNTILEVDYPRTIYAMFALNWLTGFRGEDIEWSLNGQLSKLYPVTQTSIQDGHHQWT